jgi:two-component system, LytTR family, response regulator
MEARMTGLTVLIVDDEPLARGRILRQLKPLSWIAEIHEAANVCEALKSIAQVLPDILLLDIQMPDGSGFDLLGKLDTHVPALVFITAFDDQALRAFDANAVDYVTKPIVPARLHAAMERARQAAEFRTSLDRISELEETVTALRQRSTPGKANIGELWVKAHGDFVRLLPDDITHVQAERDYVRIFANGRAYLHHENLAAMEKLLPAEKFLRIHRSSIVRMDAVARIKAGGFSSLAVVLTNGAELRVGRTYTAGIRSQLTGRS